MSTGANLELVDAGQGNVPGIEKGIANAEKPAAYRAEGVDDARQSDENLTGPNGEIYPNDEEIATLRRVHGKVDWLIYSIGIVEMVERFAYYGTTAVCEYPSDTLSCLHSH